MSKKSPRLSEDAIASIHLAYSTTNLSIRAIALQHGCSEGTIRSYARRYEWTRDTAGLIRTEGKSLAAKKRAEHKAPPATRLDQQAVVRAGAEIQALIRVAHQERLERLSKMTDKLLAEMDDVNLVAPKVEDIVAKLLEGDPEGDYTKMIQEIAAALSVEGRSITMKRLTETVEKLHNAERTAYDLDDPDTQGDTLEGFLQRLGKAASQYVPPAIDEGTEAVTRASEEK